MIIRHVKIILNILNLLINHTLKKKIVIHQDNVSVHSYELGKEFPPHSYRIS